VVAAGRNGGYGNYVRIRHSGEYSTAYAHMSRFAKGIRPGQRVRQGQVIGYVGTTGRSTGPHLHYEVLRNEEQMNPLKIKQPPTTQLAGADLERFNEEVARIDRLRRDRDDLSVGLYAAIEAPAGIWAWRRGQGTCVLVNHTASSVDMPVDAGEVLLGTRREREGERVVGRLSLEPWEALVIAQQPVA